MDLAENRLARAAVRAFARAGGVVYAECGGLLYLSRSMQPLDEPAAPMGEFAVLLAPGGQLGGHKVASFAADRPSQPLSLCSLPATDLACATLCCTGLLQWACSLSKL